MAKISFCPIKTLCFCRSFTISMHFHTASCWNICSSFHYDAFKLLKIIVYVIRMIFIKCLYLTFVDFWVLSWFILFTVWTISGSNNNCITFCCNVKFPRSFHWDLLGEHKAVIWNVGTYCQCWLGTNSHCDCTSNNRKCFYWISS